MIGKINLAGIVAALCAASPLAAQHDVRVREIEKALVKPKHLSVLEAVPADALKGPLAQSADQARFTAGARQGCNPSSFSMCEELADISRETMVRTWDSATDDRLKRAVFVAVERASTPTQIDWTRAQSNFDLWKMEFESPGYLERASAYNQRARNPRMESNCALDVWQEQVGKVRRTRSRMYCW